MTMTDKEPTGSPPIDFEAFKNEIMAGVKTLLLESKTQQLVEPGKVDQIDKLTAAATAIVESQNVEERTAALNARLEEAQKIEAATQARLALMEARQRVREKIDAASLPKGHADKLRTRLLETVERRILDDAEIDQEIGFVRELIAESGPARVSWGGTTVEAGDDFKDKFNKAVQGFFEKADVDGVPRFRDLHRMAYTWDQHHSRKSIDPFAVNASSLMESLGGAAMRTGRYEAGDGYSVGLLESMTTASWGEVFGDNLYKMAMKVYNTDSKYTGWRDLVSRIENVPSFQTRHVHRIGGYADLASVAEQGTYLPFTSPTDEEATYAVSKYGNLEDVTFEMLQDPTASADLASLPTRMARAAQRTLYKFVFNTLLVGSGNGVTCTYDSTVLFAAGHSNTTTSAGLSVGKMQAARQAMRDQTAYNESAEVLGELNEPRFLLIPNELQGIADRLVGGAQAYMAAIASNTDTDQALDPNLFRNRFQVKVVDVWTDANDWIFVADPSSVETMVMGFLHGNENPEIFVQDNPTTGSVFSADKISYKIRMIFGGTILEHRSFYRSQG